MDDLEFPLNSIQPSLICGGGGCEVNALESRAEPPEYPRHHSAGSLSALSGKQLGQLVVVRHRGIQGNIASVTMIVNTPHYTSVCFQSDLIHLSLKECLLSFCLKFFLKISTRAGPGSRLTVGSRESM